MFGGPRRCFGGKSCFEGVQKTSSQEVAVAATSDSPGYTKTQANDLLGDKADSSDLVQVYNATGSNWIPPTKLYFDNSTIALDVGPGSPTLGAWLITSTPSTSDVIGLASQLAAKQDAITSSLTISGASDVLLELVADTSNTNEYFNPMLRFSQDGGVCATEMGIQESGNSFYINWNSSATGSYVSYFLVTHRGTLQTYLTQTSTSWVSTSDERLKNVVAPVSDACATLKGINPVIYSWKSDEQATRHIGLLAQEVQKVIPECVYEDPSGNLGIVYQDVLPVLLRAIKELTARVEILEGSTKKTRR